MTTLDRIEEEADKYGFRVPYDGSTKFYDDSAVEGFMAGAKSERNKVLDELLSLPLSDQAQVPTDVFLFTRQQLESMKI